MHTIKAALAYWGAIFALGFVLGTLRVLWIAPQMGETRAVLFELPLMLAASWFAARWLVRRFGIGSAGHAAAAPGRRDPQRRPKPGETVLDQGWRIAVTDSRAQPPELGALRDRLTESARLAGDNVYLYRGDDGRTYIEGVRHDA